MSARLSPHFTLDELSFSQTAARNGWDNSPPADVFNNLKVLAYELERVRLLLAVPLLISSGYRSPQLNAVVGGASNSAHLRGLAADFIAPEYGPPFKVADRLIQSAKQLNYDQLIYEYGRWVHYAVVPPPRQGRCQVLSIFSGTSYFTGLLSEPPQLRT